MSYSNQSLNTSKITISYFLSHLKNLLSETTFNALLKHFPEKLGAELLSQSYEQSLFDKSLELTLGGKISSKTDTDIELVPIFNQVFEGGDRALSYPKANLSADAIFPKESKRHFNKAEWETSLVSAFNKIPQSHYTNLPLLADHIDTFLQCHTSLIASQYDENISFYDVVKTASAFYLALLLSQKEQNSPFLLIQGDFFGIQDFIFSGGKETNKQAAKLLRGRSFQVSLFTELAALKVLQACSLPSSNQMLNAAGKFLIITPNTEKIRTAIKDIQQELNQWFVKHTYGLVGVGIATKEATDQDFLGDQFKDLMKGLFEQLEETKLQRLDLTETTISVQDVNYPFGVCRLNQNFPANSGFVEDNKLSGLSLISLDQIAIGEELVKKKRILICNEKSDIAETGKTKVLNLPIFGYNIVFTENEEETGKFSELVRQQQIYRFWDFSIPEQLSTPVWNGYARRYINGYAAKFNSADNYTSDKYQNVDTSEIEYDRIKAFDFIACEDRQFNGEKYVGLSALMTLKGDVDNLGMIFQKGLENPTFAKIASLSRQLNQFFSLWLPAYCRQESKNMYTVFAGGDDFFLIGPWRSTQRVAHKMQQEFKRYVAENDEIHFSAGMVLTKLGIPVARLGELAEEALEQAKNVDGKNAVMVYQQSVSWAKWQTLYELEEEIERLAEVYNISVNYLYSLIRLSQKASDTKTLESSMWRSRFYYRTARYVADKLPKDKKLKALNEIIT